uniref:Uncharacterized protein n=1 Tax=Arundo donax TaxID=35708 RepID=A0A0A9E1L0_ARUDO
MLDDCPLLQMRKFHGNFKQYSAKRLIVAQYSGIYGKKFRNRVA